MSSTSAAAQSRFNFDAAASRTARDRGIKAVTSKANPEWFAQMIQVGVQVAKVKQELSADDIVFEYSKDPSRPTTSNMRAMCGVLKELQRMGVLQITDRFVNSKRVKQHSCPVRVYRSLVYRAGV